MNKSYINRIFTANMYIHKLKAWPNFTWDDKVLAEKLGRVNYGMGMVMGQMNAAGFKQKEEALLKTLTLDVTKSSAIEGEMLNAEQVRSSIARRLGIEFAGMVTSDRRTDGVVEMMLDATQNFNLPLTADRLYGWHSALFPSGKSSLHNITVGKWRNDETGPMQVVSGPLGREKVHYQAPDAKYLPDEMTAFLNWFNDEQPLNPVMKAGVAHLWFVTIHPFDDGNGRITRAITDMQLARADRSSQRFYSMSAQIEKERNSYYDILEQTQKGTLDITGWLIWFFDCLGWSMDNTMDVLEKVSLRSDFWDRHRDAALNSRQKKMVDNLLDDFYGTLNVSKWAKITKSSTDTALRDIRDLMGKGILAQNEGGGRNTSYSIILT
ncbi:Fic family protein [Mucilaginibacter flavidus]|uniref:Fic family protein n=1 Tax=Mucilaginibacter flavidus TaxID=2949309 RepID=UPI0020933B16|nr:Fic family protein [Mucilaginibacter flavidus]MCO5945777.1 Fic family protein [Mucilaginibacter flavidus]